MAQILGKLLLLFILLLLQVTMHSLSITHPLLPLFQVKSHAPLVQCQCQIEDIKQR